MAILISGQVGDYLKERVKMAGSTRSSVLFAQVRIERRHVSMAFEVSEHFLSADFD